MTPPEVPSVQENPKGISVKYTLTRGDILRFQFYLLVRNRVLIAFLGIMHVFSLWMNLRSPEVAAQSTGFKIFYSVIFTCGMIVFVGVFTMLAIGTMVMVKKYRGFLGEHELEIREDGLMERTDVNESLNRWAGFHKIVRTTRYLYIYVTDNSYHIVPLKYFGSEAEERTFRDEMEKHVKACERRAAPST
jgi:hypothetical protein